MALHAQQTTRGASEASETIEHLQEQIVRVILDTDASQLESERDRDSALSKATRLIDENTRLQAQVRYLRLKLNRSDLPSPASASALAAAVQRLWDSGDLQPASPDPALKARVAQLRERLRQAEEARKDLMLAAQANAISGRDEGQAQALDAARRRIALLESELSLAKSQIRPRQQQAPTGQSPAALTQRIRYLEAQNRRLKLLADSTQRNRPSAVKVTTAWQVELKRKMDSVEYENSMLRQTVEDLRETTSRRFDRVEVNNQQNAIIERTLAEITIREQTVRERERILESRERDLEVRAQRYRDLEERETRLKTLEAKQRKSN